MQWQFLFHSTSIRWHLTLWANLYKLMTYSPNYMHFSFKFTKYSTNVGVQGLITYPRYCVYIKWKSLCMCACHYVGKPFVTICVRTWLGTNMNGSMCVSTARQEIRISLLHGPALSVMLCNPGKLYLVLSV